MSHGIVFRLSFGLIPIGLFGTSLTFLLLKGKVVSNSSLKNELCPPLDVGLIQDKAYVNLSTPLSD